jgi:hypothetical protein
MTDFNFTCITRWVPCRDEEDIMADAGKEYEAEIADASSEKRGSGSRD